MKHRIALEIDGTTLTVTVDGSEHTFALGGPVPSAPVRPVRKTRVTAPKQTAADKPARGSRPRKKAAPKSPVAKATAAKPAAGKPTAAKPATGKPASGKTSAAGGRGAKPARMPRTRQARAVPATAADVRAWAAASGRYPDLAKTGPLPKTLRDDYAAAHAGT